MDCDLSLTNKKNLIYFQSYLKYKSEKIFGLYEIQKPTLVVCEPELIRRIMIKDFDYFSNRRDMTLSGKDEWMNEMLTMVNGEQWKRFHYFSNIFFRED